MARTLVVAAVIALAGMTSFQLLKNFFISDMSLRQSQAYSVLFVTAVTVVSAFFFLRRYDRVFDRMEAEAEQRLRIEAELRDAIDRLLTMETTVNDSPVTVVRWGTEADWSVHHVSDNISRYGYSPGEFTSGALSFDEVIHPDDRERVVAESLEHLRAGKARYVQEYRIVSRSGDIFWIEDRTLVRRDAEGTPLHDDGVIVDITERRRIEDALRESEERFRTIYETSPIGILLFDFAGRAMAVNNAGLRIFGLADLEGLARYDLFRTPSLPEDSRDRLRGGEPVRRDGLAIDFSLVREAGLYDSTKSGTMYVDLILTPVARSGDSERSGLGFVAQVQDVTARKLIESEIEHKAYHDQVTGLPNRILFEDRLQVAIARAHRDKHAVAVFFIDIDDFKNVNDLLGHDIGDLLLQSVGARLRSCLRDADTVARMGGDGFTMVDRDTVARMGGDEFTMVLPAIGGEEYAELVAQRVQQAMQSEVILGEHKVEVTLSIGIALYPSDGVDAKTLIRKADMAMYVVKDRGKAGYEFAMRAGGL